MLYHALLSLTLLSCCLLSSGCDAPASSTSRPVTSIPKADWESRKARILVGDSLLGGSTYLSSYSEIYNRTEKGKLSLTGTISMRNINQADTVYIVKADYHKTNGDRVRSYFDAPIYLAPLETVEIILTQQDVEGGTGDNFVFEWLKPAGTHDPFFEGVFITDYGQQGISFTTRGIRIK